MLNRPLKNKILTRVGHRRWRTHLANRNNRKEVDASFLVPESFKRRGRVPKKKRKTVLDHETDFEPRTANRGFESMRAATHDGDLESEHGEEQMADDEEDVEVKEEKEEDDSWMRFEPETLTFRRLANVSIQNSTRCGISGLAPKNFSFVTAKFVVFHIVHVCFMFSVHFDFE